MRFINPGFLWTLPLAAVPIIIYYLLRYRSLKIVWGANYVLERALERFKKKLYLEQLLLIAVRVLACLALVVAFARPASEGGSATVSGSGVQHVLIVDGSYSMLAGERDQTRWDRAKAAMKGLTATWGRGEAWSLYLMGERPRWVLDHAVIETPEKSAAVIDSLQTSESAAALAKAFEEVAARFPDGNVEVYIFADDQATTWAGMDKVALPARGSYRVYWVNPPLQSRANLAVTAVRIANERCLVNHPCRVFVAVRNFGTEPATDVSVEILLDGRFFGKDAISVLPGQESWVHLDVRFETTGSHYLCARIGRDALEFDNSMFAAAEVEQKLSVVVLRDRAKKGKFDSAWDYLRIAGHVETIANEEGVPVFSMGPLSFALCEDECTAKMLAGADVVLLDGGKALTPDLVYLLREYVSQGGGLVLAADETVDAATWNELLGRVKLLPAQLRRLRVEPIGGDRFESLARSELSRTALGSFETDEDGDIANSRFYSWFDLGDIEEGAEVLARFANHEPCLVRKRSELGCVLLLASGLNGRGNNLVVREFFLPFLFRVCSEAASGGIYPRTVRRGEQIGVRVRRGGAVKALAFNSEGASPVAVTPCQKGDDIVGTIPEGSLRSGLASVLIVREDGSSRVWYAVQGPRVDSDLTPVDSETKAAAIRQLGIVETRDWAELEEVLKKGRTGNEWHHWVVAALLALLAAEMVIQRRFV